ncbi:DMT family transporter [Aliagarivorans marinus]|uniref:DMT family transporter n=1 Tax=Aliagarivorans marinus TaxID=561965 RepID=UPI000407791B|nr:DMT family transporter [Aliagarivorans marinus]
MELASALRLLLLAAIWGSSFMFMRIAAPVMGAVWLIEFRVLFAALFLAVVSGLLKGRLELAKHWRAYLTLGAMNTAFPFVLLAYAALTLPASILSILNASAPLWGALIAAIFLGQRLSVRALLGMLLGVTGVSILVGGEFQQASHEQWLAIAASLAAACCYGIASNYAKRLSGIAPLANAHGSMWGATVILLPLLLLFPMPEVSSPGIWTSVVVLGVVCSGVAYLLYFRLIEQVGAASALTVTFLIPVFGVLWGSVFLGEDLSWYSLVGSVVVLLGTALVTGFSPRKLWQARRKAAA